MGEIPKNTFGNKLLQQLFEDQVKRTPDSIALQETWGIPQPRSMSYSELNRCANQLAHYLMRLGVAPESIVGVYFERSLEQVIAILAVLKAGGAFLALDPDIPTQRLEYMLQDSKAQILITQPALEGKLHIGKGKEICLNSTWDLISQEPACNPFLRSFPQNPAYLIYTSGSTGEPKGVVNTHGGLCNHIYWMQSEFPMGAKDRILLKATPSFDTFEWELCAGLLWGARLIIISSSRTYDVGHILEATAKFQVSTLLLVPSFGRVMLDDARFQLLKNLRWLFFGGEVLSSELLQGVREKINVEVVNIYGPAEASIETIYYRFRGDHLPSVIPIGRPLPRIRAYILDDDLRLTLPGEIGELYLAGNSLGRGYLNRPDLTAANFIPDPFDCDGSRLYRTGDLVRAMPDGNIEFVGRADFQVKVHGSRVEPGEIESLLHKHPAILQAVVSQQPQKAGGSLGDQKLVAHLVLRAGQQLELKELHQYLGNHLPRYMIPVDYFILDEMPITASGKINRQVLSELACHPVSRKEGQSSEMSDLEILQRLIWSEILDRPVDDIEVSFFELGGDSLLAIRLLQRISSLFHIQINPRLLFEQASVKSFSTALLQQFTDDRERIEETAKLLLTVEGLSQEQVNINND